MGKRRKIGLILLILCMILIYTFSAKQITESNETSEGVGRLIGQIFVPGFSAWDEIKQDDFVEMINYPLRKTAHFLEYAAFGCLAVLVFWNDKRQARIVFGCSWLLATGYACFDEYHQRFVAGRTGQLSDVLIDSSGALFGACITVIIFMWMSRKKGRQ